eukprot:g22301.t1
MASIRLTLLENMSKRDDSAIWPIEEPTRKQLHNRSRSKSPSFSTRVKSRIFGSSKKKRKGKVNNERPLVREDHAAEQERLERAHRITIEGDDMRPTSEELALHSKPAPIKPPPFHPPPILPFSPRAYDPSNTPTSSNNVLTAGGSSSDLYNKHINGSNSKSVLTSAASTAMSTEAGDELVIQPWVDIAARKTSDGDQLSFSTRSRTLSSDKRKEMFDDEMEEANKVAAQEQLKAGQAALYETFHLQSQQGFYPHMHKDNQDRGLVAAPWFDPDYAFFAVFDGHGPNGAYVSQFLRDHVSESLQVTFLELSAQTRMEDPHDDEPSDGPQAAITINTIPPPPTISSKSLPSSPSSPASTTSIASDAPTADTDNSGQDSTSGGAAEQKGRDKEIASMKQGEVDEASVLARAAMTCYPLLNKKCKNEVETIYSGSTAVAVMLTPGLITSINVGDSRAVLGRRCKDSDGKEHFQAVQLTRDHKPGDPTEAERINSSGGRCGPRIEGTQGPPRVWIAGEDLPGLSVTRAFGDACVEHIGVHSIPEVKNYPRRPEDAFIVIASDGLFEFVDDQTVVDIAGENETAQQAVEGLTKEANAAWEEEDESRDDITIIVVFLPGHTYIPPPDDTVDEGEEGADDS